MPSTSSRSNRRSTASTSACRRSRNSSCRAAAQPPRPATLRVRSAGARSGAPGRSRGAAVAPEPLQYLNRLSDLLFVLARVLARQESGSEVLWKHARRVAPRRPRPRRAAAFARASSSRAQTFAAPSAIRGLGRASASAGARYTLPRETATSPLNRAQNAADRRRRARGSRRASARAPTRGPREVRARSHPRRRSFRRRARGSP